MLSKTRCTQLFGGDVLEGATVGDGDGDEALMDGAGGIDADRVATVQAVIATTSNRVAFRKLDIAVNKDTLVSR